MNQPVYYLASDSPALHYAAQYMRRHGGCFSDRPDQTVTHLLLSIPSLDDKGYIKGGIDLAALLQQLSDTVVLIGGNLNTNISAGRRIIDLLQDHDYLAQNAAITAHCAVKVALRHLDRTLQECPVLVIGWGRIGKCLARLLQSMGAAVTVAARKDSDRAILRALGYNVSDISGLETKRQNFEVVFNTVPCPVLDASNCSADCRIIELASTPGVTGGQILMARGLPGKEAPRSSGKLIGKTVLRLTQGKEK